MTMPLDNLPAVNLVVQTRARIKSLLAMLESDAPNRIRFGLEEKGTQVKFHDLVFVDNSDTLDMFQVGFNVADKMIEELKDCVRLCDERLVELGVTL